MNDPEDFLTRWSRRKRAVKDKPDKAPRDDNKAAQASDVPAPADQPADAAAPRRAAAPAGVTEPAFDLSALPPIESITAATDIRPFLAPGVPVELRLAALRRAWVADPKVRDFVGLNDYDFDFHTPGAIPGFGSLEMTDALRREVAQMFTGFLAEPQATQRRTTVAAASDHSEPQAPAVAREIEQRPDPAETTATDAEDDASAHPAPVQDELIPGQAITQRDNGPAAPQQEQSRREKEHSQQDDLQTPARRGHGRALPK
jgi:hypothetical protein